MTNEPDPREGMFTAACVAITFLMVLVVSILACAISIIAEIGQ